MFYKIILSVSLSFCFISCSNKMQKNNVKSETNVTKKVIDTNLIIKREMDKTPNTEDEWKAKLTPEEYYVLREKGTERPFSGEYENHNKSGIYVCKGCGSELFKSDAKFDAHCGWPSFY